MTNAQMWTVIGVFTTLFFSMLALMSTMFVRVFRAEFGRLDGKIDSLDERMTTKIDSLESKLNLRFDILDRDVQVLYRRAFGGDEH